MKTQKAHYVPITVNLIPTLEQHNTLLQWAGSARFVYNMMLSVCHSAYQVYFPDKMR